MTRGVVVQCKARSKTSGAQCKKPAVPGALVCHYHGGAAPQVKAAGLKRVAKAEALQWATEQAEQLPEIQALGVDPYVHLEALLRHEATTYATWRIAVRVLIDSGDLLLWQNNKGEAAIHPYVEEQDKAAARWVRVAKNAVDAGVSQRRIAIEEETAGLVAQAASLALAERAHELPVALQQQILASIGRQMRQIGPAIDGRSSPSVS